MARRFTTSERLRPWAAAIVARSRYAVPALDQIALSLFGFALNLCLIRALSTSDFGVVSLWMGISLLAIGVQNALVNGPLCVQLPTASDAETQRRLGGALATVNMLTVIAVVGTIAAVVLLAGGEWAPHDLVTGLAIPLFIAAGMYREYYRNIAFGRRDTAMLLWTDAPYLVVTSAGLLAILVWPSEFATLAAAFIAMSAGGIVSQLFLRWVRRARQPLFGGGWIAAYRSIAGEVAWSLVGVFANHVETRSYVYIVTSLAGVSTLAAINAVGVLFRPMTVLMTAWSRSALPYMATELAQREIARFDRALGAALAAATLGSIAVAAIMLLLWEPMERYLLAGKYAGSVALVLPWAVASGATVLRYVAGVALQAAREYKFLAHAQIACGALSAVATVGFLEWRGYSWAMYGIALGNGVCFLLQMQRLVRVRRRIIGGLRDGTPFSPVLPAGDA